MGFPPIFALLWPAGDGGAVPSTAAEWEALAIVARQHRLRPLLYAANSQSPPPRALAAEWHEAWRMSKTRALQRQAVLARIAAIFEGARLQAQVLKGGAIAWRGWFDPALRPMRDLDLLLASNDASTAYTLLLADGFRLAEPSAVNPNAKHLPALHDSKWGIAVELHTRLFDGSTRLAQQAEENFRLRAISRAQPATGLPSGVTSLSDSDTLLHVIIHGALDHQFNNGPLLLFDIIQLVSHGSFAWPDFWRSAVQAGAVPAAQLALQLSTCVKPDMSVEWCGHFPTQLDQRTLDCAASLMIVDMKRRTQLGLPGRLFRLGWRGASTAVGQRMRVRRGQAGERGQSPSSILSMLARRSDRRHLSQSLTVARWLRN